MFMNSLRIVAAQERADIIERKGYEEYTDYDGEAVAGNLRYNTPYTTAHKVHNRKRTQGSRGWWILSIAN